MTRFPHRLAAIVLLAVVLPLVEAGRADAHRLGKAQVHATFLRDGTYRIDLVAEEDHLTSKDTGGPAGRTRYGAIRGMPEDVDRRFGRFFRGLVDGAEIAFDGRPVRPRVEFPPPEAGAPPGRMVVRLRGRIPGGARTFTWSETTYIRIYPLILQNEGDESAVWQWLDGSSPSQPFALADAVVPPPRVEVIALYVRLGFTHILPKGLDHILFVLGLFLLSRQLKPLLLQVTAFTVAHTVTLALSIYGVVSLPSSIVEPLIALSIVFVAVENILTTELRRSRIVLVFAFGLLHGLGFAGVLAELGLPRAEFLPALLSFNVGVEAGQLAVIGCAFLAVGLLRRRTWYRRAIVVPASVLIAAVGLYWSIQRMFF